MTRFSCSVLLALATVACNAGPGPRSSPTATIEQSEVSPTSSFDERVLAPRRDRAATHLAAVPECDSSNQPILHLSWKPALDRGRAQKVAVTPFANGFETGSFSVSPRLSATASTYDWLETSANGAYQWRVLTRHRTWMGSKISSFIGPSCGVEDYG